MNRNLTSGINEIEHLLPYKKPGRPGKESGMSSRECKKRELRINHPDSCWEWPEDTVSEKEERILISIAIEISVRFFFSNFIYTLGGEHYIQCSGGPIGARLTMALARLIM